VAVVPPPVTHPLAVAFARLGALPVPSLRLAHGPRPWRATGYLYEEATNALTTTVAAKITANGIETPLGVLTIGQIEKGEAILSELYHLYQQKKASADKLAHTPSSRTASGAPAPQWPPA
jgi:hypothetical protein